MSSAIPRRITINLVAGIVVTIAAVVAAIVWMAIKQNEQAAVSTERMVAGGVEAMGVRIQQLANDYSWWEEAYDAYVRGDAEWIELNMGTGITETEIADVLIIISPEGAIDYSWVAEGHPPVSELVPADAMAEIRKVADGLDVGNFASRHGYIATPDGVLMLAVQHVTPVSRAGEVRATDLPVLVFAQFLSEELLTDLGRGFLIDDLALAGPEEAVAGSPTAIVDLGGNLIGAFAWTAPTPGFAVLRNVLIPIGFALVIFTAIGVITAWRARGLAMALAKSEKEAVIAARIDSLTGRMNRTGFSELIEADATRALAAEGQVAVIYLDLNGFKAVNDSIGHHGGDDLVVALADRFCAVLPPNAVFARIGGDEFAVLLTGRNARDAVPGSASALVHALDRPFTICGFEFHVTAAVGYAVADGPKVLPSEVLRRADLAMYQAKNAAERDAVAYHATMETGALEKKQVEAALRKAVEAGELRVAYQPIVRATDLSVAGLEALVRWHSGEFGVVSPAIFIPVAEETGLIHEIGRFVFDRVCRDLADWPSIKVSVNVSPVQLREPGFADDLMAIVSRHGVDPCTFELELTEGILVSNPTIAKRKLGILKEYGFSLSLDDFGTGFSSIGYLRQFPFNKLKVDRSYVREIGLNSTANALIQALVSLGDAMNLAVVAEGIETEEQLALLRLVQCEFIQGFYVSKPIWAEEVSALFGRIGQERRMVGRQYSDAPIALFANG